MQVMHMRAGIEISVHRVFLVLQTSRVWRRPLDDETSESRGSKSDALSHICVLDWFHY